MKTQHQWLEQKRRILDLLEGAWWSLLSGIFAVGGGSDS
jgi:hypothetical protein